MPKRIIDGDALWTSNKLANLPDDMQAEYANLLPLALANGSFECDPRIVWRTVYAFNRCSVSVERVEQILDELERVGLLIRWQHTDGKLWGYWTGIDKPGRLPSLARQKERHERVGPPPPNNGNPIGSQQVANREPIGSLGFGFGFGFGSGSGREATRAKEATSAKVAVLAKVTSPQNRIGGNAAPQAPKSPVSLKKTSENGGRHAILEQIIKNAWQEANGVLCPWDGSEGKALKQMLAANPSWTRVQWTTMIHNLFASDDKRKKQRPRIWLPHIGEYAAEPLDRFGNTKSSNGGNNQAVKNGGLRNVEDVLAEMYAKRDYDET